jgi:hypothetical protein
VGCFLVEEEEVVVGNSAEAMEEGLIDAFCRGMRIGGKMERVVLIFGSELLEHTGIGRG